MRLLTQMETEISNELLDCDEDEEPQGAPESGTLSNKEIEGAFKAIQTSGFRDFLLKPELLRAIVDCGFEHPSKGD